MNPVVDFRSQLFTSPLMTEIFWYTILQCFEWKFGWSEIINNNQLSTPESVPIWYFFFVNVLTLDPCSIIEYLLFYVPLVLWVVCILCNPAWCWYTFWEKQAYLGCGVLNTLPFFLHWSVILLLKVILSATNIQICEALAFFSHYYQSARMASYMTQEF